MRAMLFEKAGQPLRLAESPGAPTRAGAGAAAACSACAVCRTDLHIIDGELSQTQAAADPRVTRSSGTVVQAGEGAERFAIGQRVGVPWLGWTDGTCRYCQRGQENLCEQPKFTGYTLDGGYAEYTRG